MGFINVKTRQVQVEIVYFRPDDRTLFFDFLPFDVGKVKGYDIMIQLYTVPGQVKYNATRRLVLKGVDGIVFVADAQVSRRENNRESLSQLDENLKAHGIDMAAIPLVLQYNKYDLKQSDIPLLSTDTLQQDLNSRLRVPAFAASARTGGNVIATLKKIISLTLASIQDQLF